MIKIKNADNFPTFLFSFMLIYLFLSPLVLTSGFFADTLIMLVSAVFVYVLLNFLSEANKKIKSKNLLYIVIYLSVFVLLLTGSKLNCAGMSFLDWILSGTGYSAAVLPFAVIIALSAVLFIVTTVFYFTHIRFKGWILIYILLIPLCFEYVQAIDLNTVEVAMLVISCASVIIQGINIKKGEVFVKNKAFYSMLTAAAVLLILASVFLPKPVSPPYSRVLDTIMAFNPFENKGFSNLGKLSSTSGARNYANINTSRLLYTVTADEPLYLRKQCFKYFDGIDWHKNDGDILDKVNVTQIKNGSTLNDFFDTLREIYGENKSVFDNYGIAYSDIPVIEEDKKTAAIRVEKFAANYALMPIRAAEINVFGYNIPQNGYGEARLMYTYPYMSYNDEYYSDNLRENYDLINFSKKFKSIGEFIDFLESLSEYDNSENLKNIWIDAQIALEYTQEVSPRIRELAQQITQGLDNDYEKAAALEGYFRSNGYVYDLNYQPEDESIEYFLFNSKTGSCGHYASAMTLMAQSIGIAARYTEGFITQKTDNPREYKITGADAHAYVEVYIPAYGFSVFEPTVSDDSEQDNNTAVQAISETIKNYGTPLFVIFITGFAVLYFLLYFTMPVIMDFIFIQRLKRKDKKAVFGYKYVIRLLVKKGNKNALTLTPNEIKCLISEKYNYDADFMIQGFEREFFTDNKTDSDKEYTDKIKELVKAVRTFKRV